MSGVRLFLAGLALVPILAWANTLPDILSAEAPALRLVGTGQLRWFGFSVYDVSLWTANGDFRCCSASQPVAIAFEYKRRISRDRLVESTVDEWKRIGILDSATREHW